MDTMTTYCKLLVVDDEMLVRQGIMHLLDWEGEGFKIVGEASNGKEALELIEARRPHIVLTDIVMPVMDGEELIRHTKSLYPGIEIIVLSSFSEFEYVRSTFQNGVADYMLKPRLEPASLLTLLKKTAQRIPELQHADWRTDKRQSPDYVLDQLLSGYLVEYSEEELKQLLPYSCYAVLLADTGKDAAAAARKEEWLENQLRMRLADTGDYAELIVRRLPRADGHIRFLINFNADGHALLRLAEQASAAAVRAGILPFLALSRIYNGLNELQGIDPELSKLLERRFFLPGSPLLVDRGTEAQGYPFDDEAFTAELGRQEFDMAFSRLNAYVSSMPGQAAVGVFEFKSFLCHSLFRIIGMLLHFHYEARGLDDSKYEYFRAIHEAKHIGEAASRLEAFLHDATECLTQNRGGSPAIQKIMRYINEHYAGALTLTEVARQFHFNPSYLSNYFTLHNKEGFNEYLNRVRIDKACSLLKEQPGLSISEISGLVGYSDHSYFTRVFRKLMGISPSQYRKG